MVQIFRPVIRQPSPSLSALVASADRSEPAPGSESPKHMIFEPSINPGRKRSRARSESCDRSRLGPNAQCAMTCSRSHGRGPRL